MSTVNNWQLTPVADIKWVPGLLFKKQPDTCTIFKVTNYHKESELVSWVYADLPPMPSKHTELCNFSCSKYWIALPGPSLTKEESVIQKIKELNKRYANRRANL